MVSTTDIVLEWILGLAMTISLLFFLLGGMTFLFAKIKGRKEKAARAGKIVFYSFLVIFFIALVYAVIQPPLTY